VVTGSNRGIGKGIARQLLDLGYVVILTSRDEVKGIKSFAELKKELTQNHASEDLYFHQLDVANNDSIAKFAEYMRTKFTLCHVLINNAGIYVDGWSRDIFDTTMKTNCFGAIKLTQALLPLMKAQTSTEKFGRIVNVTSGYGKLQFLSDHYRSILTAPDLKIDDLLNIQFFEKDPALHKDFMPAYKVSKCAKNTFTQLLSKELQNEEGCRNILVNSCNPGWCRTDMGGAGAPRSASQGVESVMYGVTLPDNGPTGKCFTDGQETSF